MRYICYILLLFSFSCKEKENKEITKLINEWDGKEIIFPEDMMCTKYGKDTLKYQQTNTDYTIVSYINSINYASLFKWKELMTELDSFSMKSVFFQFIFHPKDQGSIQELETTLRKDKFDYPIYIDLDDKFTKMNILPIRDISHTFLLDKQNKVLAIGDPVSNPKIRKLYVNIISDESEESKPSALITKIRFDKSVLDLGEFDWKEKQRAVFKLHNIGKNLLVINDIITSCGCTTVEYDKEPVKPGSYLSIHVNFKAEYPEHFKKSLRIYCNVKSYPIELKIKGIAK